MAISVRSRFFNFYFSNKNFFESNNFKGTPPSDPGDRAHIEQELPHDTLLTLEVENQEIPILISQLCVNGQVLQHPAVKQHQELPQLEQDTYLNLVVQPSSQYDTPSNPNDEITHNHVFSPLMTRASDLEQSIIDGPSEVKKYFD